MNVSKSSKCVAKLTDSLETLIQSAPSWQSFGRQGSDITPVFQPSACATDAKCPCPGTVWDQEGDWFWFDFLALFLFLEILGFSHPCGENHLTDCGIIENRDGNYWLHLHQHSHSSLPCLLCKYDVYSFIYVAPNIVHLSSRPFFFLWQGLMKLILVSDLLCRQGRWPWTPDSSASTFWVLGLWGAAEWTHSFVYARQALWSLFTETRTNDYFLY